METQNITLAISKDVLSKARQLAVERRTSLSALVTQIIVDIVDQDDEHVRRARRGQDGVRPRIARVSLADVPRVFAASLEKLAVPNVQSIVDAVRRTLAEPRSARA